MKYKITESKLRNIIRGVINEIRGTEVPGFSPNQLRNTLGIYDDDELNYASETQKREDLLSDICRAIAHEHDCEYLYDKRSTLDFRAVCEILKSFGFRYCGCDESQNNAHVFKDGTNCIELWSKEGYPRLAKFHLRNILISEDRDV